MKGVIRPHLIPHFLVQQTDAALTDANTQAHYCIAMFIGHPLNLTDPGTFGWAAVTAIFLSILR